jgi:hypothetical protein
LQENDRAIARKLRRGHANLLPGRVVLIMSMGREHWAIEVKASRHVDARDLEIGRRL